jgi:hypothetical protein
MKIPERIQPLVEEGLVDEVICLLVPISRVRVKIGPRGATICRILMARQMNYYRRLRV